jgi:hypothetical protein
VRVVLADQTFRVQSVEIVLGIRIHGIVDFTLHGRKLEVHHGDLAEKLASDRIYVKNAPHFFSWKLDDTVAVAVAHVLFPPE